MTGSVLTYSSLLGRKIRTDGLETLGTSSLTLFDEAAAAHRVEYATELLNYFWEEMLRIGEALFQWIEVIAAFRVEREHAIKDSSLGRWLFRGIRQFEPGEGDRERALEALRRGDGRGASAAAELGRVRYAALHDTYVVWIQELLTDIAAEYGEEVVCEVVLRAYDRLWKQRYAAWWRMTPLERLQLSVEGMRGHLSGNRRRGDVGVIEEDDRFVMVLDPCGSCGVLRRGDPESGRPSAKPAGNTRPHPWSWFQTGKSWYSLHSPIVMEWLDMKEGRPPFRPLENCDQQGPCLWFIYKDPARTRPEHYSRMGFMPPGGGFATT